MGKFMMFGVVASLIAVAAPTDAEEAYEFEYRAAVGLHVMGEGIGITVPAHDLGGRTVYAAEHHTTVAVGASDDTWGEDVALTTCPYSSMADSFCQESDWVSGCGARIHTDTDADYVIVVLYTLLVSEGLTVCGATAGSVAVTFLP